MLIAQSSWLVAPWCTNHLPAGVSWIALDPPWIEFAPSWSLPGPVLDDSWLGKRPKTREFSMIRARRKKLRAETARCAPEERRQKAEVRSQKTPSPGGRGECDVWIASYHSLTLMTVTPQVRKSVEMCRILWNLHDSRKVLEHSIIASRKPVGCGRVLRRPTTIYLNRRVFAALDATL